MKPSRILGHAVLAAAWLCCVAAWGTPRESICLNGEWLFHAGGDEKAVPAKGYALARVPGKFDGWYDYECDAYAASDAGWYRTRVWVPAAWADGRRIRLRFDSICFYGRVLLNGRPVGSHAGPQVPFTLDVTGVARAGAWNDLAVFVEGHRRFARPDGSNPYTAFYWMDRGTGIPGDVWLECAAPVSVEDVFIITSVRKKRVTVRSWVRNDTGRPQTVSLQHVAALGGTAALRLPTVRVRVPARSTRAVQATAPWRAPRLWGHAPYGEPVLYTLETRARAGATQDVRHDRFGFREFWAEGPDFRLNGKPIFLQGDCCGYESAFWMYRQRLWPEKMIEAAWSANIHAFRVGWAATCHPQWFDVADEMGFLLLASCFCGDPRNEAKGSDGPAAEALQRAFIRAHRNHPSILLWESNNEAGSQAYRNPPVDGMRMLKRIHEVCKEEDPTRVVTHAGSPWLGVAREYGVPFDADTFDFHPYGNPMIVDSQAMMKTFGFKGKVPLLNSEAASLRNTEIGWGIWGTTPEERRRAWQLYNEGFHPFWSEAIRDLKAVGGDGIFFHIANTFGLFGPRSETEYVTSPIYDMKRDARSVAPIIWPALSGPGLKSPGMLVHAVYHTVQWWDPRLPAFRTNILYDWVRDGFARHGMKLPPLPQRKPPEVIVTVTAGGRPVPDRNVVVTPLGRFAGPSVGARTDRQGRAWVMLPRAGRYAVRLDGEAGTLERESPLQVRWARREPAKAGYGCVQQAEWCLPASAAALWRPLLKPDLARAAFDAQTKERIAARARRDGEEQKRAQAAADELLPERQRLSYPIHPAPARVAMDGDLSEWADHPTVELGFPEQRVHLQSAAGGSVWMGRGDLSGTVRIGWAPDALYVAADVRDDRPFTCKEGASAHLNDSVEAYVGFGGPSRARKYSKSDFQFVLCPGGAGVRPYGYTSLDDDRRFQPVVASRAWEDGRGYSLEARVPLTPLKVAALAAGATVGLNLAINDADEPGARKSKLDWARDAPDNACQWPGVWHEGVLRPGVPEPLPDEKARRADLMETVTWQALDSPWTIRLEPSGRFGISYDGWPLVEDAYIGFATDGWKTVLTGHGYANWQCRFAVREHPGHTTLVADSAWPDVMRWKQLFTIDGPRLLIDTTWTMTGDLASRAEADRDKPYSVCGDYSLFWAPIAFKETTYRLPVGENGLVRTAGSIAMPGPASAALRWPNGRIDIAWQTAGVNAVCLQSQRLVFQLGHPERRKGTGCGFTISMTGGGTLRPTGVLASDAVGEAPRQLTTGGGQSPTWSPDGAWIAYHREEKGQRTLWKIHPAGGEPVPLGDGEQPAWSPGYGEQIAFVLREGGAPGVWVMPDDGSSRRLVSPAGVRAEQPAWDAETGKLLCQAQGDGRRGLLCLDPVGGAAPEWFAPEGAGQPSGSRRATAWVAAAGANQSCLYFGGKQLTAEGGSLGGAIDPAVSLDRRWIAYASMPMQPASDLFLISPDGQRKQQLTFDQLSNGEPAWSPGGRVLVFSRRLKDAHDLYLIRVP